MSHGKFGFRDKVGGIAALRPRVGRGHTRPGQQCGGGRASDGERRTSEQRRTASDEARDEHEHGVAGATDAIIVTASSIVVGDTVRAAQRFEPSSVAQMGGAEPARRR